MRDVVVVGGGIVGLATALRLLERHEASSVLVLEKEDHVAGHQTGHNSGVMHAGIYYTPGSLKATLCKAGAQRTREFCDAHEIPYRNTGKLIVATNGAELVRMRALYERAVVNGMDVALLRGAELREREPNITGLGAIDVRSTGIVDYRQVCRVMASQIEALGGEVRLGAAVTGITETASEVRVDTVGERAQQVEATETTKRLIVCAGIQADRMARLAGIDPGVSMLPFRGEYYRLASRHHDIVRSLIYPVPDPALPFLGVHLTLMMDGGVTVGPNAVLGFARAKYPARSVDLRDVAEFLRYPGFWKVARSQLRTGAVEQWNSLYKPGYLKLVQKYAPGVQLADLRFEPAGIRAQAVRRDGTLVEDFLLQRTERMLHVLNAPSPAATSALPIADHVIDQLRLTSPT